MAHIVLQACNYQVSKSIVHEIKFGDIDSCKYEQFVIYVTGILILIGSLRCLKEKTQWTCYLHSVYFKIGFLNFSNICCWYTLVSMKQLQCAHTTYVHSINEFFFTIKQVFHKLLNYFLCFSVMSM